MGYLWNELWATYGMNYEQQQSGHDRLCILVYGTGVVMHYDSAAASSWQNLTTKLVLRFEYLQPTAALAFGLMVKKSLSSIGSNRV